MNHFNFFENIRKEKETTNYPLICSVMLMCTLLVIGAIFASARYRQFAAERDLKYLVSIENDSVFQILNIQENELESNLTKIEEDYMFLSSIDYLAKQGSTVSDDIIKTLAGYFPETTRIIRISISHDEITLECLADSLETMIKVDRELQASRFFSDVFVNPAKQDSHTYDNGENAVTFSCKLTISGKGVGN